MGIKYLSRLWVAAGFLALVPRRVSSLTLNSDLKVLPKISYKDLRFCLGPLKGFLTFRLQFS